MSLGYDCNAGTLKRVANVLQPAWEMWLSCFSYYPCSLGFFFICLGYDCNARTHKRAANVLQPAWKMWLPCFSYSPCSLLFFVR